MRTILSLLNIGVSVSLAAQDPITFTEDQQLFANALPSPEQLLSVDIDGDGDLDALALGDGMAWFENLDGAGTMSGAHPIADAEGSGYARVLDVDDDGDLDILATPRKIGDLAWYENMNGFGIFGTRQEIRSSRLRNATSFDIADLDNDGDLDPFWSSGVAREIAWLPNLGNGDFGESQSIDTGAIGVRQVSSADLDGDGDLDLVAAFESTERIGYYTNTGSGQFEPMVVVAEGQRFTQCLLGDVTGDGRPDVVTMAGQDVLLIEQTDSAWKSPVSFYKAETYSGNFCLSDADGDGDLDLAAQISPETLLFRNRGTGRFDRESLTDREFIGKHIEMADLDGDGSAEYLMATYPGTLSVLNQESLTDISVALDTLNALDVSDLDGDGDKDLVSLALFSNIVAWHERLPDGRYQTHVIDSSRALPTRLHLADLDGDGSSEILVGNETSVYYYPNLGGHFDDAVTIASELEGPTRITTDGTDVIISTGLGRRLWWVSQTGAGRFGTPVQLYQHDEPLSTVTVADLNGDGLEDLVFGTTADQKLLWMRRDGSAGGFAAPEMISDATQSPTSIHARDMDGDGDLDLVSMSLSIRNEGVYWFRNTDGVGNFEGPLTISTAVTRLLDVAVEDLDRDGDADVVSISRDKRVAWYENDGLGNFGDQNLLSTSRYTPSGLLVVDLDGNGALDVVTSSDDDTIQVHLQERGGLAEGMVTEYERAAGAKTVWQQSEDLRNWRGVAIRETVVATTDGMERVRVDLPRDGRQGFFRRQRSVDFSLRPQK